jgi:hypothetical protein
VQDGYSATDGVVETTLWDGNLPRVDKRLESIEIETRNLGAGGRQIKVEYQLNQSGTFYSLGTANSSPFFTLKFPTGTAAKILQLRFTLQMTAVGTTSPELLSFRVRGQLRTWNEGAAEVLLTLPEDDDFV